MNIKPYVKLSKSQNVGYVEFYNPPHNALPAQMLSELTTAITNAGKDDDIGIIVLKRLSSCIEKHIEIIMMYLQISFLTEQLM